ncbi:Solute carrier family 22 member 5 [Liparis tanakae]|uniref:Solute carrier family 22 member 5 n=1 Tax=Liparis tanakae TaxID=230148 RepID=A0A4Z2FF51_9TELE|nr:Solute carrier family 22 member 5 [Liparis tanakae]
MRDWLLEFSWTLHGADQLLPTCSDLQYPGRVEEAENIVRKAAKWNKVDAPLVIFEDYGVHVDETKTHPKVQHNVFNLVKTKNIRNTTLILCLLWFTLSIGYFGLSLNTSQLHANSYISCFLSAAVEVVDGNQQLSRCSRFRLDVVRNLSAQGLVPGRDVNLTDLEQEGCVDGWSYSRDVYQSTIVSEAMRS